MPIEDVDLNWQGSATHAVDTVHTHTPSGRYLDPLTSMVYYYDAQTGSLSWTGEVGTIVLYAQVDVHPRGTPPSFTTPNFDPYEAQECEQDVCASISVAFTGAHKVKLQFDLIPENCRPAGLTASPTYAQTPVTAASGRLGATYCKPGFAQARLFVDDVEMARDSAFY